MTAASDAVDIRPGRYGADHATADGDRAPGISPSIIQFRRFRLLTAARKLLRDGMEVEIGGRAFDLLLTLVAARGRVLSKDEIMRRVWPSTTVDECNLRFQIAVLRKALGRDRDLLKTIPGRGYLIVEDIEAGPEPRAVSNSVERPHLNDRAGFRPEDGAASLPASPGPTGQDWPVTQDGSHDHSDRTLLELQAEITRLKLVIYQLTLSRLIIVPPQDNDRALYGI